ncbi:MAG: winged helix-turn-helix domain-containing protein [Candidatus Omnitrophota bacterium]
MITEIGIVAGEIWRYLDEHGESEFNTICSSIDKPRDTILMGLGWLAREGHVVLRQHVNSYKVILRKQEN